MESIKTKVILHVQIAKIEEKFEEYGHHKDKHGHKAFKLWSLGWYIHFNGSTESIKLFDDKPEWKVGQCIKITFEEDDG